jgi:hypothetical protein
VCNGDEIGLDLGENNGMECLKDLKKHSQDQRRGSIKNKP